MVLGQQSLRLEIEILNRTLLLARASFQLHSVGFWKSRIALECDFVFFFARTSVLRVRPKGLLADLHCAGGVCPDFAIVFLQWQLLTCPLCAIGIEGAGLVVHFKSVASC